jgi:drug/metabolite transporter (DMT)-like permease
VTQPLIGTLLVAFCAVLEGFGQVFLKKSMLAARRWALWAVAGIAFLSLEALAYTQALLFLDVGEAYAMSSVNLIAVAVLSQWILREKVSKIRWIGICLIFAGAGLVMAGT